MKSLMNTNLVTFLTAARKNRPNEQKVPVPDHVADSFLKELEETESMNQQNVKHMESEIKRLENAVTFYKEKAEAKEEVAV